MFTLTIRTAGAAFTVESNDEDNGTPNAGPELARILRSIADDVESIATEGVERVNTQSVIDVNGNRVGGWKLTDED